VRFSGTEPLLRIFAEMPDESAANAVSDRMKRFLGL
jgi:phosphomannomutase